MGITLGAVHFDDTLTSVSEKHEEVGGGDYRLVEISGLIVGETSAAAVERRLDEILHAASETGYGAALSLRPGRRLMVRRAAFTRQLERGGATGSFKLRLEARDPFEVSESLRLILWEIEESGAFRVLGAEGNVYSKPVIALQAEGDLVAPAFGDGARVLEYLGVVPDGAELVLDAEEGVALLEGEDVTPYTRGEFPRIQPEGGPLVYTDAPGSAQRARVEVRWRDRWW